MKKKLCTIFISVILLFVFALTLVACNGDKDVDKANNNKNFVAYRKKIVTVLKDNGIFVNDLDSPSKSTRALSSANIAYAADEKAQNDISAFDEILAKPEYAVEKADYEFSLRQAFGMSLKMSLCLGDGISNYFNETSFFDIPVGMSGSYGSVSQEGDVSKVRYYTPNAEQDIYEKIDLDFKSASDYSFNSLSLNTGTLYTRGNSKKQFVMMSETGVIYSPDGNSFYYTDDASVVAECFALIDNSELSVVESEFTALKDNVRYSFTDAQVSALMEKYFSDIQSSTGELKGLQFRTVGGIKFADGYLANSNESEVEISSGTEYISQDFVVWDESGTVKSLYIPKSVKGIVQLQDPKTGEPYSVPKIIASDLTPDVFTVAFGSADGNHKVFERITVENGSPLFMSGVGHLKSLSGNYLTIADYPIEAIDEKIYNIDVISKIASGAEGGGYQRLFSKITSIDVDINADYFKPESDDFNRFIQECGRFIKNLETINFHGTISEKYNPTINITALSRNLTATVDIQGTDSLNNVQIFCLSQDGDRHSITINLIGLYAADIHSDGNANVTVKTEYPKFIYDSLNLYIPENDCVHIEYADDSELQDSFSYYAISTANGYELGVTPDKTGDTVLTMPDTAVFDVTELTLREYSDIILGKNLKRIVCDEHSVSDKVITLFYDGTLEEFERNIVIDNRGDRQAFYVEDKNQNRKLYKSDNCKISHMDVFGQISTKVTFENASIALDLDSYDIQWDYSNYAYYIIDNHNYSYTEVREREYYLIFNPQHEETVYTLVRYAKGDWDNDHQGFIKTFTTEYDGLGVDIRIIYNYNSPTQIYFDCKTENYFISTASASILGVIGINVKNNDTGETTFREVKIKWELNDSYDLCFKGLEDYINPQEPDDKK